MVETEKATLSVSSSDEANAFVAEKIAELEKGLVEENLDDTGRPFVAGNSPVFDREFDPENVID
jgi:hypothetical protein